jgi:hypothetical protein
MARSGATSQRGAARLFVNFLWAAAGLCVVLGFLVRPIGRFFDGPDLRLASAIVIAIGLLLAVLGWIGEMVIERRKSG